MMKKFFQIMFGIFIFILNGQNVFSQVDEAQKLPSEILNESIIAENIQDAVESTVINEAVDFSTLPKQDENTEIQEFSNDILTSEEIAEKALKPIGWAIGGVVAPAVIIFDYTNKTIEWSFDNVAVPIGRGVFYGVDWVNEKSGILIDYTAKYTIDPIFYSIEWSAEKILYPAISYGAKYTIIPVTKGLYWSFEKGVIPVLDKTGEIALLSFKYGAKYVIIPLGKGMVNGVEYVAVPIGKGIMFGAKYTVIPVGKCVGKSAYYVGKGICWSVEQMINYAETGIKYTIVPIGKGIDWSFENIAVPIGHGVGKGVKTVVVPINNSVKYSVKKIMFWKKK